ncbi:DUF6049 family protein [Microbacterium neungamense]|uniref:DUF6049 family protein n=1 Tax=Microbacterium neungamense TaxID=2810535 RepID=UPI00217E1372|nr:DUF6049 family protein [Microbacterium neungamense]UWF77511.1 hypothetical protein JSY13_12330 [Microbacterium neungamense]
MTATIPRSGLRTRAQRLLSRLAAVLVVGGIVFGGTPAVAATEEDETADAATAQMHLNAGTTVTAGAPLLATVTLETPAGTTLSAGSIRLEISRTPLADGAALDAWLDEGSTDARLDAVADQPTAAVAEGSTSSSSIVVSTADLGLSAPGVYPVRATLTGSTADGEGDPMPAELTATTVVTVPPAAAPAVAVMVPITATPEDGSLLTADEVAELTEPEGALTQQLDAVSGTSAVIAVDPAIAASVRRLGTRAPASAVDWLARLEALPNETFTLLFADADATVQAQTGRPALLEPGDLTALLDPADFASASPTPTPSPSATPGTDADDPALPDAAELTAIRGADPGILWPTADVTDGDLAAFGAYLGDQVATVLPSTSVDGYAGGHAAVGARELLVTDARASARLSAAVEETEDAVRDRDLAAAAGHLFFASGSGAPVLVGLDRSETRTAEALRAALTSIATPGAGLAAVRSAAPAAVTLTGEPDAERQAALTALLEDEQKLVPFSSVLEEPELMLVPERIRILRLTGVGPTDEELAVALQTHRESTRATLGAVSIQKPSAIQLFTAAAPLPVWVRNDLPWPVRVTLTTQPSDPRLKVQRTTEVKALAASNTRVTVPVEARVASGELRVEFRLHSPTGVPIDVPQSARVTLRADWEGIGLVVLGGIIVVLLGLGVLRTVLRKRREARQAEEPAPGNPPGT